MVDESDVGGRYPTLEADLVDQPDVSDTPLVSDTSKPVTPYGPVGTKLRFAIQEVTAETTQQERVHTSDDSSLWQASAATVLRVGSHASVAQSDSQS